MNSVKPLPSRLHHNALVVKDLSRTRWFYEDVLGLPLTATYCEAEDIGGVVRKYCHCFFSIADGGALAFFQFEDPKDDAIFSRPVPDSPFYHVALKCDQATQDAVRVRLESAGYDRNVFVHEHGYCRSLYVTDPDGMGVEFAVDSDDVDQNAPTFTRARDELERWLAGDHTPNNVMKKH